ncbi:hypothetical protein Droror1_Dr00017571 [Drosera rotundifolia]
MDRIERHRSIPGHSSLLVQPNRHRGFQVSPIPLCSVLFCDSHSRVFASVHLTTHSCTRMGIIFLRLHFWVFCIFGLIQCVHVGGEMGSVGLCDLSSIVVVGSQLKNFVKLG